MYSVYQHWDPLKVCVLGRSYPPEFYSWITVPHVRSLFERIAMETEEDFQNIKKCLERFGVTVMRPSLPDTPFKDGQYVAPPMTPRDHMIMIDQTFHVAIKSNWERFYHSVKDPSWPDADFDHLPAWIQQECVAQHGWSLSRPHLESFHYYDCYSEIFAHIAGQNNIVNSAAHPIINGAMVSRIGRDLYFGTESDQPHSNSLTQTLIKEFEEHRVHIVNTRGHSDGTYCPVCPGLIISLYDVPHYHNTFPDWEVVYLPGQSWAKAKPFLKLKEKNAGKWWIPGFEHDQAVIDVVQTWLNHWTGYVEETVFDVNMLIIDPKNVMVFNYNKQVFDALTRYGITPHVVPFRHRYFWDGGIHCVTSDLHRDGTLKNFFPNRD